MTMAKQISRATQAARDSEGTKKRTGRKPTYVVTLSDEDKEFLTSFIAKRPFHLSAVGDGIIPVIPGQFPDARVGRESGQPGSRSAPACRGAAWASPDGQSRARQRATGT